MLLTVSSHLCVIRSCSLVAPSDPLPAEEYLRELVSRIHLFLAKATDPSDKCDRLDAVGGIRSSADMENINVGGGGTFMIDDSTIEEWAMDCNDELAELANEKLPPMLERGKSPLGSHQKDQNEGIPKPVADKKPVVEARQRLSPTDDTRRVRFEQGRARRDSGECAEAIKTELAVLAEVGLFPHSICLRCGSRAYIRCSRLFEGHQFLTVAMVSRMFSSCKAA